MGKRGTSEQHMDTKKLPVNVRNAVIRANKDAAKLSRLNTLSDVLRLVYIDKMIKKTEQAMEEYDIIVENFCLENVELAKSIGIIPLRHMTWAAYEGLHVLDDAKK